MKEKIIIYAVIFMALALSFYTQLSFIQNFGVVVAVMLMRRMSNKQRIFGVLLIITIVAFIQYLSDHSLYSLIINIFSYITFWNFLKVVGVALIIGISFVMAEDIQSKSKRVAVSLTIMGALIGIIFFFNDNVVAWLKLIFSVLLLFDGLASLHDLLSAKPGSGSALTAYFVGTVVFLPLGFYLLSSSLKTLGLST
ncbi:hypothetical protein JHD50_03815 [Sulfurimonas sp. MAG313]|nr:hypothetical protein [Sulfurimonas sp. MAG313]MDF1880437.1 hypothetical protein [Sulfurimonas sp. MAG313]